MPDQESTPAEGQEPKPANEPKEGQEPKGDTPETFDREYVQQLRSENAKWRTEAQQRQEKLEEYEEQNKSELEKAQTKATKAEQARLDAESKLLRFEVAAEKQLPKELVPRLRGSSREELEADADELLNLVKSRPDTDKAPDFDGGAREPAPDADPVQAHNQQIAELLLGSRTT